LTTVTTLVSARRPVPIRPPLVLGRSSGPVLTLEASPPSPPPQAANDEGKKGGGNGNGNVPPPRHPFIEGLLKTLPEPDTEWPAQARAKWLQTAANIFDLIYKGDGGIEIRAAMANRSPRPNE
jgi:hypothetical protein